MKKKFMLMVSALVLVAAMAVGGTLAYLTAQTQVVTNTFTIGDISIELKETTSNYKMVPGQEISKDPKVTVKADSEDCWLFVKIDESDNLGTYISYSLADGWTELTTGSGVYWREVASSGDDQTFGVLAGDKVTVKSEVTTEQMTAANTSKPTLTFTAYAIQAAGFDNAADAWKEVSKS